MDDKLLRFFDQMPEALPLSTEPYPNRWTHHVLVSREEEIDGELLGWVEEAASFSAAK